MNVTQYFQALKTLDIVYAAFPHPHNRAALLTIQRRYSAVLARELRRRAPDHSTYVLWRTRVIVRRARASTQRDNTPGAYERWWYTQALRTQAQMQWEDTHPATTRTRNTGSCVVSYRVRDTYSAIGGWAYKYICKRHRWTSPEQRARTCTFDLMVDTKTGELLDYA